MKSTNKAKRVSIGRILLIIPFVMFCGCSDDFLEPDPMSFYEPEATLSTEPGLQAVLAMADRHLRSYWTFYNSSSNNISVPIGTEYMFSELAVAAKTDDASMFADIATILTPTGGAEDGDRNRITYFWKQTYQGIKYANTITSFIGRVEGLDEATRNAYLGRAYFHRSFRYLSLVFQFGDVPLVTKIIEVPKLNYRSTRKEAILEMITKDMEFAVQWVPDQKDVPLVGMINKGACRQLLIKCYLATGQFDKAKEQADILIDQSGYQLMKTTFGTFNDGGEPQTWPITRNVIWDLHRPENKLIATNKEVILGMPNRGATAESMIRFLTMRIFGPFWSDGNGLRTPDGKNAVTNYARSNTANYNALYDYTRAVGRGIGTFRATHFAQRGVWIVNGQDDTGDLRHNSAVGNWGTMTALKYNDKTSAYFGQNIMLRHPDTNVLLCTDTIRDWFDWPHYKIYLEDVTAEANQASTNFDGATNGGNADWYFYRLAETYLLRAEAKFYLGDATGAANDVNEVRKRALCNQLYTTVTIGDIMDERARELYLEEWRNVELKRVSYCLALSGKPDEWGNSYSPETFDKQSGTNDGGGSYWWQRIVHHGMYNRGPVSVRTGTFNYTLDKRNMYWPIPDGAITANSSGVLSQNFGYPGYDPATLKWQTWEEAVADEDKVSN